MRESKFVQFVSNIHQSPALTDLFSANPFATVLQATTTMNDQNLRDNINRTSSKLKEVLVSNGNQPNQSTTVSGALIDQYRYVIGTERGLLYVDSNYDKVVRIGLSRPIHQIEYLADDQLLVVNCDKERHIRLVPSQVLSGEDVEWIKVSKTKGCTHFTTGVLKPKDGSSEGTRCLCVAIKQKILLFEINSSSKRHKRLKDIRLPAPAQSLNVISDGRIIVGYPSGFTIYSLSSDQEPLPLMQPQNSPISPSTISHQGPLSPLCAVEMSQEEYLLVFSSLAIYVDSQGRRTRQADVTYSAPPKSIVHCNGHLLIYTETHIDVVDCSSANIVQTLNMKQCRPLTSDGLLSAIYTTDKPYVVYLRNKVCDSVNRTRRQRREEENGLRKAGSESSFVSEGTSTGRMSVSSNRSKMTPSPSNFHNPFRFFTSESPRP